MQLTNECMSMKHEINKSLGSRNMTNLDLFEVFKLYRQPYCKFIGCFSYVAIQEFLVVNSTPNTQIHQNIRADPKRGNCVVTMVLPGPELNPYFFALHHHIEFLLADELHRMIKPTELSKVGMVHPTIYQGVSSISQRMLR